MVKDTHLPQQLPCSTGDRLHNNSRIVETCTVSKLPPWTWPFTPLEFTLPQERRH